MVDIKSVMLNLNKNALGGAKIPHCVSNPVLRLENGTLYIAAFVYTYNRENLKSNQMPRPVHWILADMVSGEIVHEFDCRTADFSQAEFGTTYDLNNGTVKRPTREEFEQIYALFDEIRSQCTPNGLETTEKYVCYFNRILEVTPRNYQRFYQELSNI